MDLTSLYRRLSEYQSFKREVEGLVASLRKAIDPLNLANNSLKQTYLYDDIVADNGRLQNIQNRLDGDVKKLENNILPEIDRKISSIESSIEDALAQQAMEEE